MLIILFLASGALVCFANVTNLSVLRTAEVNAKPKARQKCECEKMRAAPEQMQPKLKETSEKECDDMKPKPDSK